MPIWYIPTAMPAIPEPEKSIEEVVREVGRYPIEAYNFVQRGLGFTVQKTHGEKPKDQSHITGRQLSEGLREFAQALWGHMAGSVLTRWNLNCTEDFGRIVFAMVDNGFMQKTDDDTIDDFREVFDFRDTFFHGYRIEPRLSCDSADARAAT